MTDAITVALISGGITLIGILVPVIAGQISARRAQSKRLDAIEAKLVIQEKDTCRTQLLLLMADYPREHSEILTLARHYFADLKGDWYLTGIFNQFLQAEKIGRPEWFSGE